VVHHLTWQGVGQIALMLAIMWWMYSGFVWLTNEVAPSSSIRRTLLFVGMAGFLCLALSIPGAFHDTGWAFGIGYFFVNAVHTSLFLVSGGMSAVSAMKRFAPLNMLSATLVLAGGFIHGWPQYALWGGAVLLQLLNPALIGHAGFNIRPRHFAERHGLVVIVALGETVIALGVGLAGLKLTPGLIGAVVLGLVLAYVLYWAYFGFDDERAEHALARAQGVDRARKALVAYGYAHYPMLLGIVLAAAGIKLSIGYETEPLEWPAAWALAGGVGLFFLGHAYFRYVMGVPRPWMRLVQGAAAVSTVALGVMLVAWVQLVVLIVVVYALVIVDDLLSLGRWDIARR
jgi:low temperature requirement protein LtrA